MAGGQTPSEMIYDNTLRNEMKGYAQAFLNANADLAKQNTLNQAAWNQSAQNAYGNNTNQAIEAYRWGQDANRNYYGQFDQTTRDLNNEIRQMYGLEGLNGEARLSQDQIAAKFNDSPFYKFMTEQAAQQTKRQASASRMLQSGNSLAALQDRNQQIANAQWNDYMGQLSGFMNTNLGASMTGQAQYQNNINNYQQARTNANNMLASQLQQGNQFFSQLNSNNQNNAMSAAYGPLQQLTMQRQQGINSLAQIAASGGGVGGGGGAMPTVSGYQQQAPFGPTGVPTSVGMQGSPGIGGIPSAITGMSGGGGLAQYAAPMQGGMDSGSGGGNANLFNNLLGQRYF